MMFKALGLRGTGSTRFRSTPLNVAELNMLTLLRQSCHQTTFGEVDKEPLVKSSISTTADGFYNQLTREDQSFPYVCPF